MYFQQQDIWQSSVPIHLEHKGIDVWRIGLNRDSLSVRSLFQILSSDEKQKANKFHFAKDRDRFIVARSSLRKIIGGYLDLEPDRINFFYNRFGKPCLEKENKRFRFNLSHSQGFALIAVVQDREIGIDIEFINEKLDVLKIAQSVFSLTEISTLQSLPSNLQTRAFFRGWTRKEAYIKALGQGFSFPLEQFTVSVMTEEPGISFKTYNHKKIREWSLVSLPSEYNYMAALSVEGKLGTIRYRQLSEN